MLYTVLYIYIQYYTYIYSIIHIYTVLYIYIQYYTYIYSIIHIYTVLPQRHGTVGKFLIISF